MIRSADTTFGDRTTMGESTYGSSRSPQPIGSLLRELADDSRTLIRQEVELAKAELSEKASVLGRNAAYLAVGAFVLYTGALALVAAACIGAIVLLDRFMDLDIALWLGPLAVGVIIALIGYAFVQKAISTFKNQTFTPRKTINTLRENTEWLKNQMTSSPTSTNR